MKTCTLCKQAKELSEFTKHSQKKDGFCSWCKPCKREKDKIAAAKRKNKKAEYDKIYREKNLDKIEANSKEYRKLHKKEKAIYDKKYRKTQGQKRLNQKKDYYHNKGGKEIAKKWYTSNPDKIKSYNHNKDVKRRNKEKSSKLTNSELQKWLNDQILICTYCGKLCKESYHIDHIEPLSKNGTHSLDNLTIACPSCNQSKGAKHLLHWLATIKLTDRS